MNTSPLERAILTHYWTSPTPWKDGSEYWRPVDSDAVYRFVELGLLLEIDGHIEANKEALSPYMDALASVPLPTKRWVVL